MAVSVPGAKAHDTALTATWPPKRMVSSRVSSAKVIAARIWADDSHRSRDRADYRVAGNIDPQRLLRIGMVMSSILISRTSWGTPQANAGSTLILKWYIDCIAW